MQTLDSYVAAAQTADRHAAAARLPQRPAGRAPPPPRRTARRLVLRRAAAEDARRPRAPRPPRQRPAPDAATCWSPRSTTRSSAAVPVGGGRAIADPFRPTADIVELLRARAERVARAGRPHPPAAPPAAARPRRLSGAGARLQGAPDG